MALSPNQLLPIQKAYLDGSTTYGSKAVNNKNYFLFIDVLPYYITSKVLEKSIVANSLSWVVGINYNSTPSTYRLPYNNGWYRIYAI